MRIVCLFITLFSCFTVNALEMNQLETLVTSFMNEKNIPGLALAIYDGSEGKIICFGLADREENQPVTADTIFDLASITKVFTGTDLGLQVLRKKMSLNDPVSNYLPQIDNNFGAINQVTLLQLATHSSSLPKVPPKRRPGFYKRPGAVMAFLQQWTPTNPIGSTYRYSNLGFGILGYALESLENQSFENVIINDIATPLGMTATMVHLPPMLQGRLATGYGPAGNRVVSTADQSPWPGGGALRSSISDMLKFLEANLQALGPQELQDAMQFAQEGHYKANEKLTMGLGWHRIKAEGVLFVEKNGGLPGFSSYIGMFPDKKVGVVLLANKAKTKITHFGRQLLIVLSQN